MFRFSYAKAIPEFIDNIPIVKATIHRKNYTIQFRFVFSSLQNSETKLFVLKISDIF